MAWKMEKGTANGDEGLGLPGWPGVFSLETMDLFQPQLFSLLKAPLPHTDVSGIEETPPPCFSTH